MLLTVKKQIEETVEVKTPAYYKTSSGHSYINENGQLTNVRERIIFMWEPSQGKFYTDDIEELLRRGEPCTKEEFDAAFVEAMDKMKAAVGLVEVNS